MADTLTTETAATVLSAPLARGPFDSMSEITRAHRGHFFDESTMRGFSSRLVDDYPLHGRFFRTTEQDRYGSAWGGQRRCSLRFALNDGQIETVEDYGAYSTAAAKSYAEKIETVQLQWWTEDDRPRRMWRVMVSGPKVERGLAGSKYYDLQGALSVFDDLTGNAKRAELHSAISALSDARHALYNAPKVQRQIDALGRRHDALVAQVLRKAGLEEYAAA